jgi:putative phage-type endonuclease
MNVFQDKTCGETEEIDNEAVRQGRDLENYVAQRFMEATGKKVRRANVMYCNEQYPFMIADIDRLIVGEDAGLECKTVSAYSENKWKDGDIPLHYIIQCYHYMAVTGKRTWYIAALVLGRDFVYRKLSWDDELISRITEAEKDFWENHVLTGIMPEPDGSEACNALLGKYFHTAKKSSRMELAGFDGQLCRREEIMAQIAQLQKEQNAIEQKIKLYMQDNELAVSGRYRISWSNVDTVRFDVKRFRQEKPELYQDYSKVCTSRRFHIKTA